MREDPRGSLWRRWDLHFHTPASYDYGNKALKPAELVSALLDAGVAVVAVTDHHVIDTATIEAMQRLGDGRLTVLPGIELRSELGGSPSVHYTGVFPEAADLGDLQVKLQGQLGITPADVRTKGDDKVYVPFERGCQAIHELGGVVAVHAGRKANTIERLSNADVIKREVKVDLARSCIDVLEVGREADCEGYRTVVFPHLGSVLPLILCSDCHDAQHYSTPSTMWVKADPNFLGLLQLLNEPEHRLYLGECPPGMQRVQQNATKYLRAISFDRTGQAKQGQNWFSGTIPLNYGLVAIIGKKGSGKSALADAIGLLGRTTNHDRFSFLTKERFRSPRAGLASGFRASAEWASGAVVSCRLDEVVAPTDVEDVKYLPQSYLEDICTELKDSTDTRFDRELKEVIFSHIGEAERLGCGTLDDLIAYKTEETRQRIATIQVELSSLNARIAETEKCMTHQYRQTLEAQLAKRQAELTAHEQTKPRTVRRPESDPNVQAVVQDASKRLKAVLGSIVEAEAAIAAQAEKEKAAFSKSTSAAKLLAKMANLERQYQHFVTEGTPDAVAIGLSAADIAQLTIDRETVEKHKLVAEEERQEARAQQDPTVMDSLASELAALHTNASSLRHQLDEPNQRFQQYLADLDTWTKGRVAIVGTAQAAGSVEGLKNQLAGLSALPNTLRDLEATREGLCREIHAALVELVAEYRRLFAPVQEFISGHRLAASHVSLEFEATVVVAGFGPSLFGLLSHGRRGSFYGEEEGNARLSEILVGADLQTADGTIAFTLTILDHLRRDFRTDPPAGAQLSEQLRQGVKVQQLYDMLFSLDYLVPRFELRWQGKTLDQLSPGERGQLLLIFYLLIDKRDTPLVIDQPEENLDNETIASVLVPCVKDAKDRRQIIIVTHNPNLALVCDADQVIHATMDKADGNRVVYTTGAIENPLINRQLVDVLEGTKPAFELRGAKYRVVERI